MSTYATALKAAIAAAREAGALLLAEFHRAGGPRGHGSHADVDAEAEALLRDRLLAACAWGYRGEETGHQPPPDGERHYWIVDPNDGTVGYLRGARTSAISIAAVLEGEPVLGVVFAFASPDDTGDLIAWAEGCGPVTRNGVAVKARLDNAPLEAQAVVYCNPHADRNPEANSAVIVPGRYRGIASLAYRLALPAVGEGVVGVYITRAGRECGPASWDIAGGHALLRGAGGLLVGLDGEELVYTADGEVETGWCFGGSRDALERMLGEEWDAVLEVGEMAPSPFELTALAPGRNLDDAGLLARAQGCWLGQLTGDALGQMVEFNEPKEIRDKFPDGVREMEDHTGTWQTLAGQPTDDSEMALMLARTLARDGAWSADAVRASYIEWYNSRPFDIGMTTSSALRRGVLNETSQANGSLMRVSPLGIFGAGGGLSRAQLLECARADSALTHPHALCQDACAVFVAALASAIRAGLDAAETFQVARRTATTLEVQATLDRARFAPPADFLTHEGWVLIALQNAFYHLLHTPDFRTALQETVAVGGDTDTNAAIAGALLGAVHGREAIPATWRRAVLTCRPLVEAGAKRPRPRAFWPVDALELAENLVLAGQG